MFLLDSFLSELYVELVETMTKKIRLHLGCGLVHRPGWINIDHYSTGATDLMSRAVLLPFSNGVVDTIASRLVVEQLGYVGTLYALYEWWRVLVPGGTLIIETPDRPVTFKAAINHDTAPESLPWIFGSEQVGFSHRYLFDADELIHLVVEAGFEIVSVQHMALDPAHPTLQLTARRLDNSVEAWFTARLHRAFITSGLLNPDDAPRYLVTLETVSEQARQFAVKPGRESLVQLVNLSARYSPEVTACILDSLPDHDEWPEEDMKRARALVTELERMQFPSRLAAHWRIIPKLPGKKDSLWAILEREISFYLAACLFPGEGLDDIRKAFDAATDEPSEIDQQVEFFSEEVLTGVALWLSGRGVRAFARGHLEESVDLLELALSYEPDLIWPRWNLARLYLLLARRLEALGLYEAVQAKLPERLHAAFKRELHAVTERTKDLESFMVPLVDLRELLVPDNDK